MCIPHGATQHLNSGGRIKRERDTAKTIAKVSKDQFEKGDPNFKDERTHLNGSSKKAPKKGWLAFLLGQ